jgi:DNA-nicking Smr family endonuclease
MGGTDDDWVDEEIVEMPIDGVLDLHTFHPKEVKALVPDYLDECRKRGIFEVRIIHGKGKGTLRRIVHAALDRHPLVKAYRLGGHGGGSWGATVVDLKSE